MRAGLAAAALLLLLLLLRAGALVAARALRRPRALPSAAPEVVCLWSSRAPAINPACDRSTQWSSQVPVEILELRHIFGDVLVLPAPSLARVSDTLPPRVRVLIYSTLGHSLDFALAVERLVRPRVSVVLSDEYRRRPDHLALAAPCVMRQYADRGWDWPAHVRQLPILTHCWDGLAPDSLAGAVHGYAERTLDWCFAGTPKGDRGELCAAMRRAFPSHFAGQTEPEENARLYGTSRLALNPRGNSSLECSRAFSAMRLGCVPVGVAAAWEVQEAFGRLRPRCPLLDLYADSTEGMVALARGLLEAPRWTMLSASVRAWDAECLAELKRAAERA